MTLSEIFEGLTAIGLFISVALVFIELRRNGNSTRLNNSIKFTERHFNLRNSKLNHDLADALFKGRQGLSHLNGPEKIMFASYLLNAAQTATLMARADQGLQMNSVAAREQSSRIIKNEWDNQGGREYWDEIKNNAPVTNLVKDAIEKIME